MNAAFSTLRRFFARWRAIHWILLGGSTLVLGAVAVSLVVLASAFDTTRDLSDFSSPEEARAFVAAHLPAALPEAAVVEKISYERWTDWHLTATVRLPSADAAERYLERAKVERKLNDGYCGGAEPSVGSRYFLPEVSACGSVTRASPQVLEVVCFTR